MIFFITNITMGPYIIQGNELPQAQPNMSANIFTKLTGLKRVLSSYGPLFFPIISFAIRVKRS